MPEPTLLRILARMDMMGASDLFLAEERSPSVRVDGAVQALPEAPTTRADFEALFAQILSPSSLQRLLDRGDLDSSVALADGRRFRLNLFRHQGRFGMVARAVPVANFDFEQLGLPPYLKKFAEQKRGLILVTGATGSGKSTTLAAIIRQINKTRPVHIITIEDPIEFIHPEIQARITQREVGNDTTSFHVAMRQAVRQSPDVILIGELRDEETVMTALQAALTGHLVLGTLHTVDTTQTLQRLLNYFPESLHDQIALDLSLTFVGIVCQRLVPRIDGQGRMVAVELLSTTPAVSRLLRERRIDEIDDLMQALESDEMITFNRSLLSLIQRGEVAYDVAKAFSTNPDELALMVEGMSTRPGSFRRKEGSDESHGHSLKALLAQIAARGASDLHLGVGRPPMFRVDGALQALNNEPLSDTDVRSLLNAVMNPRQRSTFELEREVDFALALESGQRFRVNGYFQKGHMAAAFRAIPSRIPDAGSLRIPQSVLGMVQKSQGLLLVVGPTGSGKSTTLACLINQINYSRACRIITIEDPIEYVHNEKLSTIDQREVSSDTKSFATALKYVLRQDPDVILVGEMRDQETISAVLTAAETGHLVLATLHANDAIQAMDRIIDSYPAHQQSQIRTQLASALIGVVSQRLLPKKAEPGRVGAFEVMVATPAIRALIRDAKTHQAASIMEASRKDGCITLDQALTELYERGAVSLQVASSYMANPKNLNPRPLAPGPR